MEITPRCAPARDPSPLAPQVTMTTKIWLSTHQKALDPSQATLSVFDRGFLYGDSVYETLRSVGPRHLADLGPHLDRLERSAQGLAMEEMPARSAILDALVQTLEAAQNEASRVRIVVTRGTGPISIDTRQSFDPLLVVFVQPLVLPQERDYQTGISACVVHADASQAGKAGLKTGNYLPNIMALRRAIERKGQDAILCNQHGEVTEAATSNLFMVREGSVFTPDLEAGLLPGITRSKVMELAQALGLTLSVQQIRPEELREADEIFLTSSVRGLMPVTELDERSLGSGQEGPITHRLRQAYEARLAKESSADPQNIASARARLSS